jgi:hypothetical protein
VTGSPERGTVGEMLALYPPREASGTAWLPDRTPMQGVMRQAGGWDVMIDGHVFVQYLYEATDRHRTGGASRHQGSSANWGMVMARRTAGAGRIGLRAMLSAEPWTVADCGFLNLLATGEVCEGDTIHDRQHPHDLLMELAADYERPIGQSLHWQLYGGLSGEPALGPVAFSHRPSAAPNPMAPISHHWLDSTHVTFGLVTTGISGARWKAEMSVFNGREPDAARANLDLAPLDSVSGRVWFLPSDQLAIQVSSGYLHEAETPIGSQPPTSLTRTTASATWHRVVRGSDLWATTVAYGVNSGPEIVEGDAHDMTTHAVLAESAVTLSDRHTWFGRFEVVGKPAESLHAHEYTTRVFTVGKLEAGYVWSMQPWRHVVASIGVVGSANMVPPDLVSRYGNRIVPGIGVFLRLRPPSHLM